jgi:hypothetical protein
MSINVIFVVSYLVYMYKIILPVNCPSHEVEPKDIALYRLMTPNDLIESFKSYVELDDENLTYKKKCKAYALSFFDNIEKVKELLKKENNEGKVIAKVNIKKEFGSLSKKPSDNGHFSLWLFKDFNPSDVSLVLI